MNLYKEQDIDIAKSIEKLYKESRDRQKDWREEAEECFNFVAGNQWDEQDIEKLSEEGRPVITFNRCNAIVSAILGMEANQRQEVSYRQRGTQDGMITEAVDTVANWVRDYAYIEQEEAQAFEDMLVVGMGWTESRIDYDVDLDGKIVRENVYCMEMAWDSSSRKRNLSDAKWVARGKKMTMDEIKAEWPDAEITISEQDLKNGEETTKVDYVEVENRYQNENASNGKEKSKPTVIQFQWYESRPIVRLGNPITGEIKELDEKDFKAKKQEIESLGIPYIKQKKRKYYQAFVCGGTLLEKSESPCQNGFTFKCITGKHDKVNNQWYGIVRMMRDPQRWANRFFSSFIDIIMANSKGGVLVETGAVSDIRKFEEDWSKADSAIFLNPGALAQGKIQPKPQAQYPIGVDKLMQFSIDSIYSVTGVNLEVLGMVDRAQPGMVEESRKRSAYTILATFFDSLSQYRREAGMVDLEYIKSYLPESRIAEVLKEEMKPLAKSIKSIDLMQMHVIVSESPISDNNKMMVWGFVAQVLPSLVKMGIAIPPAIIDYTPLPPSLAQEWKNYIEKQGQNPMAQMQQQMGMAKAQSDIQKTQSDAELNRAKATNEIADARQMMVETALGGNFFGRNG